MPKLPQNLITLLLGVLVINVVGLWTVYLISKPVEKKVLPSVLTQEITPQPSSPADPELVATDEDKIAELKEQLDEISEAVSTLSAEPQVVTKTVTQTVSSSAKEYVVYLGSGSTTSREWVEIEGTKTTINTSNYPTIKNVEFQALISNDNGETKARLKNKTTGGIFHNSEVAHGSSTASWISKTGLYLHGGSNEYVVELKSTSGEMAQLDGARLRITTK